MRTSSGKSSTKASRIDPDRPFVGAAGAGKSSTLYLVRSSTKRRKRFAEIWQGSKHAHKLRTASELVSSFRVAEPRSIWLSSDAASLRALAEELPAARGEHRLLVFESIPDATRQVLSAFFRYVLTVKDSLVLLDSRELIDVLSSEDKQDLFVGGTVDLKEQAVVLYRGSLDPLVVPLTWFAAGPRSPRPDFNRLEITDSGQTVRLGDFEAAADAILYEFDPEFRARSRKRALETDDSFGASLRRLRLQKGVAREDFNGIAAKTIARIERGEIERPHDDTLSIIAARLGVLKEQLGTF